MPVSYRLLFSFLLSINYGSALAQPCLTPTISGIQTLCVGDTLTITAESGFSSYMWSNGTNGAATDIFAPGTYQLTVTCFNGQTNVSNVTIPAFSTGVFGQLNLGAPICEGECNILLLKTFNSDNDPFTFTWELSTGGTYTSTVIDQANDIVLMEVCPSETTTYTLLSFTNSIGCEAFLDPSWLSTKVTVIPDEPATISGPSYTCSNQPATLIAMPDGQAYHWSNGSNNQQITVTQPGTYTVTVTSGGLCTNVASVQVTSGITAPTISGGTILCADGTLTLTAQGPDYVEYRWSSGETTPDITVDAPGTYAVIVTSANGCTASATTTVTEVSSIITSITGPTTICEGNTVTLGVDGSFSTYAWSNGSTAPSIQTNQPGSYSVTVTNNGGCTGTASTTLASAPLPTVALSIGNPDVCGGTCTPINAAFTGAPPFTLTYNSPIGLMTQTFTGMSGTFQVCPPTGYTGSLTILATDVTDANCACN